MAQGLGNLLRTRRKALGLNQDEVAERAGLDRGTISRVENGKGGHEFASIERIAQALGTSVSDLRGGATPEPLPPPLDQQTAHLIECFSKLRPRQRRSVVEMAELLLEGASANRGAGDDAEDPPSRPR